VSAKLCGDEERAPPIFGRAAITLGIGPHSSYFYITGTRLSRPNEADSVGLFNCPKQMAIEDSEKFERWAKT